MKAQDLKGIFTALSVPFCDPNGPARSTGGIDELCFKSLVKFQLLEGVDGFVVNGTTGESPCLSLKEQEALLTWVFETLPTKPIIAGIGGNNTQKVIENTQKPFLKAVSAFLAVVPYYNRPPQRGLVKHFETVADKACRPLVLYNVPARTGQGLSLDSIIYLSQHPNIIGIKEATGDLNLGKSILKKTNPQEFSVVSGDDETWLELCALGANGVISVVSHIIAREMKLLLQQVQEGGIEKKQSALKTYQDKYGLLLSALYAETNPIGVKMALKWMGLFNTADMRLPLVTMDKDKANKLKLVLEKLDMLHKPLSVLSSG